MDKIKVSKAIQASLEYALRKFDKEKILKEHMNKEVKGQLWVSPEFMSFNDISSVELAKALFVGYEIEGTPEEELLNVYRYYDSDTDHDSGLRYGMLKTLNTLGVKIEGINQ